MADQPAATSAPETTAPASAPAPATTPAPIPAKETPSAAVKADTSNRDGKNKFERPTPRKAIEEAVTKQREKQSAPAKVEPAKPAATQATASPSAPSGASPAPAPAAVPKAPFPADRPRTDDGKFKKLPRGWKSQLAQQFEALPPEVQEEAHRREDAAYDGIKQYTEGAARWGEIEKAIQPYMATIRQMGASPAQAIQYLFNIDHTLRYGTPIEKQRTLQQVAQTFGVDLGQVAQVPQESQEVAGLRQQIAAMNHQLREFQQAQGQAQLTPYMAQIEQFKAEPGHEHFADLEPAMTGLIGSGAAKTLAEAYEQALWARPDLREAKLAEQRQSWEQEQAKRVEAAKNAAIQVRGTPPPATPQTIDPKDRRAVILNAYQNLQRT